MIFFAEMFLIIKKKNDWRLIFFFFFGAEKTKRPTVKCLVVKKALHRIESVMVKPLCFSQFDLGVVSCYMELHAWDVEFVLTSGLAFHFSKEFRATEKNEGTRSRRGFKKKDSCTFVLHLVESYLPCSLPIRFMSIFFL